MAIVAGDIKYYYSGGGGNTDPAACLGGAISTAAEVDNAVENDLWDDVSSSEATAGDTEYRAFYVKNTHGSLALTSAKIFVSSNTTAAGDTVDLGVRTSEDVGATLTSVANESTAPTSVTFAGTAISYATGIDLNTGAPTTGLVAGQYRGVWMKRVVTGGAAAATNNTCTIAVQGDTLA